MKIQDILTPRAIEDLLVWYRKNRRALPWRESHDPYRIWISEIMLQQTRVEAVKPYYARFLETCPTVESLAAIDEERLMKLWEGLGYYSRARNLQRAARTVVDEYGGRMPTTYEGLLSLSGIGDYTAGAIASIAYDCRVPAIDGNVLRVLARISGSREDITDPKLKSRWREELTPCVPTDAGDFTQSLIELGATVCVPNGAPRCDACPLASVCRARAEHLIDEIPVRAKKKPRRIEPLTVLIIRDGSRTVLHKRPNRGLLAGLFELPNVKGHLPEDEIPTLIRSFGLEPLRVERLDDAKHIFTHIEWHMRAYSITITPDFDGFDPTADLILVPSDELHGSYAIPSAFSAYVRYL